ncbi:LptA/OstA family protein [Arvimicrobium flavum]|uniref:LptA/OstA family protein n=1 Tax=Arvimicrobium flavum TaxID=3393320 RepID=UPI00237BF1E6|nr:LptA/OstA family protein [Mesorhizobium shangrilense]
MRGTSLLAFVLLTLAAGSAVAQEATGPGIRLAGDQPIQIESDKLEVREAESMAIFSGNVNVVQGDTLLKAGLMTVYYAKGAGSPTSGSQQIERLEVKDKVYLRSKEQVATGDEGQFDVASNTLVLTGKEVVLTEGANVAKGRKLTVNTQTGKSQLEGRVQVLITPSSQGN